MLNILLLGLVSFFSDISAEMVYPIIPLYLTSVFGATPILIGIIEGIAESLASLLKVFSGFLTDNVKKKKPIAFFGYATGLFYKLALLISTSWTGILLARIIDRIGKGIRTVPRDVLVSESAGNDTLGRAFGIHKALDMAGSAIGILIAFFLIRNLKGAEGYHRLFILSMIPAILGLAMLALVKEKKQRPAGQKRERFWTAYHQIDNNLKLYLVVAFIFTLGNSSNAFLLLKAKSLGFNDQNVVLLYFIYNATAALLSVPAGRLSDKIGRKSLLICGYLVFCGVYAGFAFAQQPGWLVAAFIAYGFYTAMIAGTERALIAEIAPAELKGTMLGLHATLVGVALLPASMIAGWLWNAFDARAMFLFGAALALVSAVLLQCFLTERNAK